MVKLISKSKVLDKDNNARVFKLLVLMTTVGSQYRVMDGSILIYSSDQLGLAKKAYDEAVLGATYE